MNFKEIVSRISKDTNGCWLWDGALDGKGYGQVNIKGKNRRVHRVIYECFKGPVPDHFELDHRCEVNICCNPKHLKIVTHQENMRRGLKKRRKTHCIRGHSYKEVGYYRDWKGSRTCKKCHADYYKDYRKKKA